ncbi:hypothetical protein J6TS1_45800 [Siminovitchia terrae]|uniref:DUF2512 family protein n=1 Tax=Siminovitchia terrae TaxID=1914933 RepID=A0A429X475_SIMTE|nr:DUF2512 family protein [Siminovitchia terrae]RST58161.1 DUF2512 family protein [Siminovitchia terrae]GIN93413.1 hypothetical protein J22TS1_44640 [Siminovitchia terrae]GIN98710.1 hypothetical protein J6TS1_45800 [Siminovitchia terrae]
MENNINHSQALLRKAILTLPFVWIILSVFNDVSFVHSTLLGIALVLISYFLGDLMILPRMGNTSATISDFILSLLVIWGGLNLFGYDEAFGESLLTAVILTIAEYFFHLWMERTQFNGPTDVRQS